MAYTVGASVGEIVMTTVGSSRQSKFTERKPVDAAISGIIDKLHIVE